MKKKVTAIALAVCILAVAVIGATMAYFTDTDSKTNTFTFGKVDIDLTEDSTNENGAVKGDISTDGGITYPGVLPGLVYSKVPTVTVKNDSLDAWVIITATVPTVYDWDGLFNDIDTANFTKDRKIVGENTVYYFYANAAVTAGSSVTPFTEVKINPALTQNDVAKKFDMVINAYAIQKDGFSNAEAAFTAAFTPTSADALSAAISNAEAGDTIVLQNDAVLTAPLTIDKDITIEGNGATISAQAIHVTPTAKVTFKGMNFDDTTGKEKTSSVYGSEFKGTLVFEDCTFGASNWEAIQVTPAADCKIIIKNCTFTAPVAMKRFIHIQAPANNNYKVDITVTGCTFVGCENTNYNANDPKSVIDFDFIAAGSTMTLGNCSFFNTDGTTATDAHAYFCAPDGTRTYDYDEMYDMLTGTVTTYTVK